MSASSSIPSLEKLVIKEARLMTVKVVNDAVFYSVVVKAGRSEWTTTKRYSQFESFHTVLMNHPVSSSLPGGRVELPGKKFKFFVAHDDPNFIEERRCLLEAYLKRLIAAPQVASSEALVSFLKTGKGPDRTVTSDVTVELADDAEVTDVSIPATRNMSDHVLFQIDVVNIKKRASFAKWTVLKRFGQFFDMHAALRESLANDPAAFATLPPPPARKVKLLFNHMDAAFVEQRRTLLENYLKNLLACPHVVRSEIFLAFLGVSV
jgi:hypothetical protein